MFSPCFHSIQTATFDSLASSRLAHQSHTRKVDSNLVSDKTAGFSCDDDFRQNKVAMSSNWWPANCSRQSDKQGFTLTFTPLANFKSPINLRSTFFVMRINSTLEGRSWNSNTEAQKWEISMIAICAARGKSGKKLLNASLVPFGKW